MRRRARNVLNQGYSSLQGRDHHVLMRTLICWAAAKSLLRHCTCQKSANISSAMYTESPDSNGQSRRYTLCSPDHQYCTKLQWCGLRVIESYRHREVTESVAAKWLSHSRTWIELLRYTRDQYRRAMTQRRSECHSRYFSCRLIRLFALPSCGNIAMAEFGCWLVVAVAIVEISLPATVLY